MTRDPIQRLLDEHVRLMAAFEPLRTQVIALARGGDAALPVALPVLREANRIMNTELLAHARREDDVFFAAVEAHFGDDFGPTRVMRQEHRDIHGNVVTLRETLHELNQVEHPAIVAGMGRLDAQLAGGAPAATLRATAAELLERLDAHFAKEEQVLFPIARDVLSAEALAEVARKMDDLDAAPHPGAGA
jgi:regulator of cell morphogenesis and NO signaling